MSDPLKKRLKEAFDLQAPASRLEATAELIRQMDLSAGSEAPEIDTLIDGLHRERDSMVLATIWGRLSRFPNPRLRAFAESELDNPAGEKRKFAVQYLGRAYPAEWQTLYRRMANDRDSFVLHELGQAIVEHDRRAAVELWFKAMDDAPQGLANEILPFLVGKYADAAFIAKLRERAQNPYDDLARIALWQAEQWNSVDYLQSKQVVEPGSGYLIQCPNCGKGIVIRDGHAGERGRCRLCRQDFVIPLRPPK